MKKRNIFLLLSTILMGVFSLASLNKVKGVQAEVKDDSIKTTQIEAALITEGTKIYLAPAIWNFDGARYGAYFFGDGDTFLSMAQVEGNPLYYEVTMNEAKSFTNVIFVRMDPGKPVGWDAKWNQTGNLEYDGTNNLYTITGWGDFDGTWSVYVEETLPPLPTFTSTTYGITESKVRIWLDRSGHYESGYTITMRIGETYYKPTGYEKAIFLGVDSWRYFCFYDMPKTVLAGKHVDLVIFLTDVKEEKVISVGTYVAGDNNKVWKMNESEGTFSLSKGKITERIVPSFLTKVLEGYLTCSSSAENGYNAFPQIDENFLPRDGEGYWNMEGNLDEEEVVDYVGVGDGGYGSDRGEGVKYPTYDKYVALRDMYNDNNPTQNLGYLNTEKPIVFVIIISVLGITALAGLYFLRKKKVA